MVTKAHETVIQLAEHCSNPVQQARFDTILSPSASWAQKVRVFHEAYGIPSQRVLTELSVSDRLRRLIITFEEFREQVEASGFRFSVTLGNGDIFDIHDSGSIGFSHIEGSHQDLIEIADGNADVIVTSLGTAIEHGFDIDAVFNEVMYSNMTKFDAEGNPLINLPHLPHYDESKPVGKILKSSLYVEPDIAAVITKGNES